MDEFKDFYDNTPEENSSGFSLGETPVEEEVVAEKPKKKKGKKLLTVFIILLIVGAYIFGNMIGRGLINFEGKRAPVKDEETVLNINRADLTQPGLTTVEIAKKAGPSVVGVVCKSLNATGLFGQAYESQSSGSGIILTKDGYIVTNNHVIEGANSIVVVLNTGSEYEATLVGTDAKTEVAVLKIKPEEELVVAEIGDSSVLEVGEKAVAIGNPLGMEFFGTVTEGIISAVNRTVTVDGKQINVIQTDASINTGNSGGALINRYGQVVGINTAKISSDMAEGMGFAIPFGDAQPIIDELIKNGYVTGRPMIGVSLRDINEYVSYYYDWPVGTQIIGVSPGSGADEAGLKQGDIITGIEGTKIKTADELNKKRDEYKAGEIVDLEVYKYATGKTTHVKVRLSEDKPQ